MPPIKTGSSRCIPTHSSQPRGLVAPRIPRNGSWWFDKFLPFGLRTAPFIFDLFASGLQWILENKYGWNDLFHYLDDFLAILPPLSDTERCGTEFEEICAELGF